MPTKTTNPADLEQRAEELNKQAAEARAQLQAQAEQQRARERERMAEADRALLESYDRIALDRDVEEARQRFEQAVREAPLTNALAGLVAAGYRRNWAVSDAQSAHSRLGLPGDGPRNTEHLFVPTVSDAITRGAERLAQAQLDADRADKKQS